MYRVQPLRLVRLRRRLRRQVIEGRINPGLAGAALVVDGEGLVVVVVGIRIVLVPAIQEELQVQGKPAGVPDFRIERLEGDIHVDAVLDLPGDLVRVAGRDVGVGGVVGEGDLGPVAPALEGRPLQGGHRGGLVELLQVLQLVVGVVEEAEDAGGGEGVGDGVDLPAHLVDEAVLVDGLDDGLADLELIEGRVAGVRDEEARAGIDILEDLALQFRVRLEAIDLGGGDDHDSPRRRSRTAACSWSDRGRS